MNARLNWFLTISLFTFCEGCGSHLPELEQAASTLKPKMTEPEVSTLFSSFKKLYEGKQFDAQIPDCETLFQTNIYFGKRVSYGPKRSRFFEPMEYCEIYFDSNNIIIGFCYLKDDGRKVGSKPREGVTH